MSTGILKSSESPPAGIKQPLEHLFDQETLARTSKIGAEVPCDECGKPFVKKRNVHYYCSPACRAAFRDKMRQIVYREEVREYQKKWNEENFQKKRNYMLKYTFGITPEQYDQMLVEQNHRCYICQKREDEFKKKLAVDHDHLTNEIRGLLCHVCNKLVLGRQRDPLVFERAAEYLRSPRRGWVVPPKKPKKRRKKKT